MRLTDYILSVCLHSSLNFDFFRAECDVLELQFCAIYLQKRVVVTEEAFLLPRFIQESDVTCVDCVCVRRLLFLFNTN